MTGLVELLGLAGVLLAALTWIVVGLFAPRTVAAPQPSQALAARMWIYAIVWAPALLLGAALLPGLLALLGQRGDHCLAHEHHHHLCLLHPPHATGLGWTWLVPAVVVGGVGVWLLGRAWLDRGPRRLARTLVATSRPSPFGPDVRVLDQPEPLALTVGISSPTILVSTGLLDQVGPTTLAVVLAHERAHVARHDTRKAWLDRVFTSLLPRELGAALLARLGLARELACDAAACEQVGDPIAVARALTEVARLGMRLPASGLSIVSAALPARVRHLLDPRPPTRSAQCAPLVVVAALVLAGAGPLHGVVERLISFALH